MSTEGFDRVEVLLVGLPGFYESLLRRELGPDPGLTVSRLGGGEDEASGEPPPDADVVIVVSAEASSLRMASELMRRGARILGTVAVTDDEPRGDVYRVAPAGMNVTRQELAQVIRDVVASGRAASQAERNPVRGLTRSNP